MKRQRTKKQKKSPLHHALVALANLQSHRPKKTMKRQKKSLLQAASALVSLPAKKRSPQQVDLVHRPLSPQAKKRKKRVQQLRQAASPAQNSAVLKMMKTKRRNQLLAWEHLHLANHLLLEHHALRRKPLAKKTMKAKKKMMKTFHAQAHRF